MKMDAEFPFELSLKAEMENSSCRWTSGNSPNLNSVSLRRVFLADRQTCVRELLKLFLGESRHGCRVVGEAAHGAQLLRLVEETDPELIIFDLAFPDLSFQEIIRGIRQTCPHARLLAFSCFVDERLAAESLALGVHGVVDKESSLEVLCAALEAVRDGGVYFDRRVPSLCKKNHLAELTARETHVLRLIAEGRATKEIADLMDSTVKSVARARERVMAKLDLHDAVKLTHYAIRRGLVSLQ
jgi:DNA-binding NarL/FixJ family response regulator